jgi:hypothetical protein
MMNGQQPDGREDPRAFLDGADEQPDRQVVGLGFLLRGRV